MWQNITKNTYVHSTGEGKEASNKKAQVKEDHTTSSPEDWLLPSIGSDLRLDCKRGATIHQLKKKKKQREREREREKRETQQKQQTRTGKKKRREKKERGLTLLSLSTDPSIVFCLQWVHPEDPK